MREAWVLAGATATGKTAVAHILAERIGAVVVSADSMSVYKEMDIGTAKLMPAERGWVTYLGIDLVTPDQSFSTGNWLASVKQDLECESEKPVIVAGGTGLYIKAVTQGLDAPRSSATVRSYWQKVYAEKGIAVLQEAVVMRLKAPPPSSLDLHNPRRLIRVLEYLETSGTLPTGWEAEKAPPLITLLRVEREDGHQRIAKRVRQMFAMGLVEETAELRARYTQLSTTAAAAIGYREALALLDGTITREEAIERTMIRTRQLAKRQMTWFRHQANGVWLDVPEGEPPLVTADKIQAIWRQHEPAKLIFPQ